MYFFPSVLSDLLLSTVQTMDCLEEGNTKLYEADLQCEEWISGLVWPSLRA